MQRDAEGLFGGNTVVKCLDLTCKECVGNSGFALFKGFTHANYGQNTVFKCGFCAHVNGFIRLTEILSALTVTDNCVFDTYTFQHVCTELPGVAALLDRPCRKKLIAGNWKMNKNRDEAKLACFRPAFPLLKMPNAISSFVRPFVVSLLVRQSS